MKVDYLISETPTEYKCSSCRATGCKLWRDFCLDEAKLFCASCAAKNQKISIKSIDGIGTRITRSEGSCSRTDQIGCFAPAIPHEIGFGFWSYMDETAEARKWWEGLPTFSKTKERKKKVRC